MRAALLEDLGRAGDLTTDSIVPEDARTTCALVARQPGVVCGLDFALWSFRLIDPADRGCAWRCPTAAASSPAT